jgi:hypothetical protein
VISIVEADEQCITFNDDQVAHVTDNDSLQESFAGDVNQEVIPTTREIHWLDKFITFLPDFCADHMQEFKQHTDFHSSLSVHLRTNCGRVPQRSARSDSRRIAVPQTSQVRPV